MQFIGTRISIIEKENALSVVILSYRSKLKNLLVVAWMLLFSVCGILAIIEFRAAGERDRKIFWLVFISFWIYFELVVLKAFLWRLRGKEKIIFSKDSVRVKRDVTGFEKYKEYRAEQIANWRRIERDPSSLVNSYENAYWYVGGERVGFNYYGKEIRIGSQLNQEETGQLLGKIKHYYA